MGRVPRGGGLEGRHAHGELDTRVNVTIVTRQKLCGQGVVCVRLRAQYGMRLKLNVKIAVIRRYNTLVRKNGENTLQLLNTIAVWRTSH